MILYILTTLLLVAYFEILGQYLLNRFNCNSRPFAFGYGFLLLMAFSYITVSLVTVFHGSFYLALGLYAVFVITSLVFIIRDFKKTKYRFNPIYWLVLIVLAVVLTYYSYNTTLGDLNGFDSVSYMNYVSTNVGVNRLDSIDLSFGGYVNSSFGSVYEFQSYYKFASVIVYLVSAVASIVGIETQYSTIYVWVFQLLFTGFFLSVILNSFERYFRKKSMLNVLIAFILVFFVGKLYYNNVLGFIGNCYRPIGFAYCTYELIDYLEGNNKTLHLFYILILGTCAFTSSAVFSIFFLLFASLFVLINREKHLFKQYGLVLLFPAINLIYIFTNKLILAFVIAFVACTLLFIFNDFVLSVLKKKGILIAGVIVFMILMMVLSYLTTGTVWNLSAFTDSLSEKGDMTLNYFNLDFSYTDIKFIFKFLTDLTLILYVLIYRKDSFAMMIWVLVLCIFNPLCIGFLATKNIVFYRAFDVVINPFTLFYFTNRLFEKINKRIIVEVISVVVLVFCITKVSFNSPYYYHDFFVPDEDYDYVNKMSKAEYDAILILKDDIYASGVEEPYIITVNRLTESLIPNGKYIYNRSYSASSSWSDEEKMLYDIFYPREYGTEAEYMENINLSNIAELIEKAGIDYIVLKNDNLYYDSESGTYYPLYAGLNKYIYDNLYYYCEEFSVYRFAE